MGEILSFTLETKTVVLTFCKFALMNWQNSVNASECISLYKTVSSEDVVGMVDKCKEKN